MQAALALVVLLGCGSTAPTTVDAAPSTGHDAPPLDGVAADAADDGSPGADGTPMRRPCVDQLGTGLSTSYGRLDGFLVAIVPAGSTKCNGDSDHVHLQILADDMTYDIAVNIGAAAQDVHTTTRALTFPAWSEGWHPGAQEDYVTLGVHSTDLPLEPSSQIVTELDTDLATVNHITVFATGYGNDGAHLVHRNGNGHDGLIVTQPLSSPSHARMFSFSDQSF
jgi:hypothetical protein